MKRKRNHVSLDPVQPEQKPKRQRKLKVDFDQLVISFQNLALDGWKILEEHYQTKNHDAIYGLMLNEMPVISNGNVILKPHQIHAVKVLELMEEKYNGGVLSDECGLGKTFSVGGLLSKERAKMENAEHDTQPTLVIVPPLVLGTWEQVLGKQMGLKTYTFHRSFSKSYKELALNLETYDVVLTTMDCFRDNWKTLVANVKGGKYRRVVIDEAHKAVCSEKFLDALAEVDRDKTILSTGTPLQNDPIRDLGATNEAIMREGKERNGRAMFDKLQGKHLGDVLREKFEILFLRRLKSDLYLGKRMTSIPEKKKETIIVYPNWSEIEVIKLIDTVRKEMKGTHKSGKGVVSTRMLQACCNEACISEENGWVARKRCFKCNTRLLTAYVPCCVKSVHDIAFCGVCVRSTFFDDEKKPIPNARINCKSHRHPYSQLRNICGPNCFLKDMSKFSHSAKSFAVLTEIQKALQLDHRVIVVCQYRKFLMLLNELLKQFGVKTFLLTGSTSRKERDNLGDVLNKKGQPVKILLLSLYLGEAITLIEFRTVIFAGLWWNPHRLLQAEDRVHRIGQKHSVRIIRFQLGGTVEDIVMKVAAKKLKLANLFLGDEGL